MQSETAIKDSVINLINSMPKDATWDDIMYEIYVKQKIEKGLTEVKNNNVISHKNVEKIFAE